MLQRHSQKLLPVSLFVMALSLVSVPAQANSIADKCNKCHGENGNSESAKIPSIAGISSYYFIETMKAFQTGDRPATTIKREGKPDVDMKMIADNFDQAKLEKLADHYAKQAYTPLPQKFDAAQAALGKKLHLKNCEKCHEDSGRSTEDDAGLLAGQRMDYLRDTLNQIIAGDRTVSKKMKKKLDKVIKKSGPEAVEQLVQYYGSKS